MKKIAFLKKKSVVFDFDDCPNRETVEYEVYVFFQGNPYISIVFTSFEAVLDYMRDRESYGLTYEVIMRSTSEHKCKVSFDGELPF